MVYNYSLISALWKHAATVYESLNMRSESRTNNRLNCTLYYVVALTFAARNFLSNELIHQRKLPVAIITSPAIPLQPANGTLTLVPHCCLVLISPPSINAHLQPFCGCVSCELWLIMLLAWYWYAVHCHCISIKVHLCAVIACIPPMPAKFSLPEVKSLLTYFALTLFCKVFLQVLPLGRYCN